MNTGQLSWLGTGVWLIPILLLSVLVGVYGLVRSWQRKTARDLKTILPMIRHWEVESLKLSQMTRGYSRSDRPPFGDLKARQEDKLDEINAYLNDQAHQYVALRERTRRYNLAGWKMLFGAAFYWFEWFQLQRECSQLKQQVSGMTHLIQDAGQLADTLFDQGWRVTISVRESLENQRQLRQISSRLSESRYRGDAFDEMVQQVNLIETELDQIPKLLLSSDEQEVRQKAEPWLVSDVYEKLSLILPRQQELSAKFQDLETRYAELDNQVSSLKQRIDVVKQLVFSLPAEIELATYREKLQAIETIAAALRSTLSRLEVESVPLVATETDQTIQTIVDMEKELRSARRQLYSLEPMLGELLEGQKNLAEQFADLAKRPVHPIQWLASRQELTSLSSQISLLGPVKKSRTPDQLDKDLQQAKTVLGQYKRLAAHIEGINKLHIELLLLLDSDEVKLNAEWQQETRKMLAIAAEYDPENWLESQRPARVLAELNDLSSNHALTIPKASNTPIPEAELEKVVQNIRILVGKYRTSTVLIDKVDSRLKQVQEGEKIAQERFQTSSQFFFQVELLIKSNPFLETGTSKELKHLAVQIEQCSQELDERRVGIIDKKVRKAQSVAEAVEAVGNGWLKKLNQDIDKKKQSLAEKLERLRSMAVLEDSAVIRVQNLLSQDLQSAVVGRTASPEHVPMQALLGQLKFRNDLWQNCVAAIQELEEKVENPLADVFQEASLQRARATELIQRAEKQVPQQVTWPPTSASLISERQEMARLEEIWSLVKTKPTQAIWAVRKYSELAVSFRELTGKIQTVVEKSQQDKQTIAQLEAELENHAAMWRLQEQANARDSHAVGQIRELRADVSRGIDEIKRKWLGRTRRWQAQVSYEDMVRELKELSQEISDATVEVGIDTDRPIEIGIDGFEKPRSRDRRWR